MDKYFRFKGERIPLSSSLSRGNELVKWPHTIRCCVACLIYTSLNLRISKPLHSDKIYMCALGEAGEISFNSVIWCKNYLQNTLLDTQSIFQELFGPWQGQRISALAGCGVLLGKSHHTAHILPPKKKKSLMCSRLFDTWAEHSCSVHRVPRKQSPLICMVILCMIPIC